MPKALEASKEAVREELGRLDLQGELLEGPGVPCTIVAQRIERDIWLHRPLSDALDRRGVE
jgi:hypothetical protein